MIDTPFGRVSRYVYSTSSTTGRSGGINPPWMEGGGLFGALLRQLLGGRRTRSDNTGMFEGFEHIFNQDTPGAFEQKVLDLPAYFKGSSFLPFLRSGRLRMALHDAMTEEPLGVVEEVGTNILSFHAEGHSPVKAHRTYRRDDSSTWCDVIHFTSPKGGRERPMGRAEEFPKFSGLLALLNNIFTRYLIYNEKGEQVLLLKRWQLPFFSRFTVHNAKDELVASARMPLTPFPSVRFSWTFVCDTPRLPVHPSLVAILAGFVTKDKLKGLFSLKRS